MNIKNFYFRYERHISSVSLVGGFVFDIFALERVDQLLENIWIGGHLLVAAAGIILINFYENTKTRFSEKTSFAIHFWLIILIQFAFGGLLSTFLVFYFRSASFATSWFFLLLLIFIFAGNELFKKHYSKLVFQILQLFLSIYFFAIYVVPVALHQIGAWVFILSGIISLILISFFIFLLSVISRERFKQSRNIIIASLIGSFLLINLLYFANIIPPIPLSLKDAGVYHSINRDLNGDFKVTSEDQGTFRFFRLSDVFHAVPGGSVYVYSAVFSPTNLNTEIIHRWQYFNPMTRSWVTDRTIPLSILGGRDEGFRTYTMRTGLAAGLWRVDVENKEGASIGRIRFQIITTNDVPQLTTETK